MDLFVAKKELPSSERFSTILKSKPGSCTKQECRRQRLLISTKSLKNTRTSAFLPGTFPSDPRLRSCMRSGELSSSASAAITGRHSRGPGRLVRKNVVEAVDGLVLAVRGSISRAANAKDRLHSHGQRPFDFFHRIGNKQKPMWRVRK